MSNAKIINELKNKSEAIKKSSQDKADLKVRLRKEFREDCKNWLLEVRQVAGVKPMGSLKVKLFKWFYPPVFATVVCINLFGKNVQHSMHDKYRVKSAVNGSTTWVSFKSNPDISIKFLGKSQ